MKLYTHYEQIIIDSIDLESYDVDTANMTLLDKINKVLELFKSEYIHLYNVNRPLKTNLKDWLQGLPTLLSVPFYNFDILEDAKKVGFILNTEAKEDKFLHEYWLNLADALITLKENL